MSSGPRLVGLTGGIASGKSTVSALLRGLGAHLIDADALAREVVEPGEPGLAAIAQRFPGVVDAQGRLDRKALGARVFADPSERAALNALLHPLIQARFQQKAQALFDQGVDLVIYDVPLLIENGLQKEMTGGVILVAVPPDVQRERLMARDALSAAEAEARMASQLPLEKKKRHATWIVDNSGNLESTREQVARIWEELNR